MDPFQLLLFPAYTLDLPRNRTSTVSSLKKRLFFPELMGSHRSDAVVPKSYVKFPRSDVGITITYKSARCRLVEPLIQCFLNRLYPFCRWINLKRFQKRSDSGNTSPHTSLIRHLIYAASSDVGRNCLNCLQFDIIPPNYLILLHVEDFRLLLCHSLQFFFHHYISTIICRVRDIIIVGKYCELNKYLYLPAGN